MLSCKIGEAEGYPYTAAYIYVCSSALIINSSDVASQARKPEMPIYNKMNEFCLVRTTFISPGRLLNSQDISSRQDEILSRPDEILFHLDEIKDVMTRSEIVLTR